MERRNRQCQGRKRGVAHYSMLRASYRNQRTGICPAAGRQEQCCACQGGRIGRGYSTLLPSPFDLSTPIPLHGRMHGRGLLARNELTRRVRTASGVFIAHSTFCASPAIPPPYRVIEV